MPLRARILRKPPRRRGTCQYRLAGLICGEIFYERTFSKLVHARYCAKHRRVMSTQHWRRPFGALTRAAHV